MLITDIENEYDVAIIGTDPAGISLALRLPAQGCANTLLVESGNFDYSDEIFILSKVDASGDLSAEYLSVLAKRIFGDISTVWNGYCV